MTNLHPRLEALVDRPTITLSLELPIAPHLSEDSLRSWAMALLEVNHWEDPRAPSLPVTVHLPKHTTQQTELFFRLVVLLLDLVRLPTFDRLAVQRLDPSASGLRIRLSVPAIELIPEDVYRHVVQRSAQIGHWLATHATNPATIEHINNAIAHTVLLPLKRMIPAGQSTLPVLKGAHELGIPFRHLGRGVYQLGWGSAGARLDRTTTIHDSALSAKLAQDKAATNALLNTAGLPVPEQVVTHRVERALDAAHRLGWPVVVKPIDRDRGEGVHIDVTSDEALKQAFADAQALSTSRHVIVERQVSGLCHRIFVAAGEILYAVNRRPTSVLGDGVSTVAALVADALARERAKPLWSRSELKPLDALAEVCLHRQGLSAQSVPEAGVWVALRPHQSNAFGGFAEDLTDIMHPDNAALALAAAKIIGLHVVGVDLMTEDIAVPWYDNGAVINEVNHAPNLGLTEVSMPYIHPFLQRMVVGDGRIPVAYAETLDALRSAFSAHRAAGRRTWVTTAIHTWDAVGQPQHLVARDLLGRARAVLCRSDVDALVVFDGVLSDWMLLDGTP